MVEDNEQQIFKLRKNAKGLYRASVKWKMNDKEYYLEKVINI